MIPHGTREWYAARLGRVTASRIADVVGRTKTGWGAARANYMNQLIAERLSGHLVDGHVSAAMQWGINHEAEARLAYQFRFGTDIADAGFVEHPTIDRAGASPDGLLGDDGLVEFKCPTTATHLCILIDGAIAERHELQMLWQLACTGRQWCDFVSYDPRLPEALRLYVKRIQRDDDRIRQLEAIVVDFLAEIDAALAFLHQRYGLMQAA